MPKLQTTDGETVADGLTPAEVSKLREMGVDVSISDTDGDSNDADAETDETGSETDNPDRPETHETGETPEDASEESSGEPDPDDRPNPETDESDSETGETDARPNDGVGEDFADRDIDEMLEEAYDVEMDAVREPDERDRARWESLLKQLSEYGKNIPRRKRERDERIEKTTSRKSGDEIRTMLKQDGIISDLKDGFQKLVSRPTPRPARSGSRMDMQNVVRRASGDMTVRELFEEDVQVETGDRCIGLATDISGSMGSDMIELKKAGAAVAKATEIIGDAFVWEAFTDEGGGGLDLRIVTGPQESFRYDHLDSFTSMINEPTAAGIRDCRMLMEQTAKHEYTMLVITDGQAMVGEDGVYYGLTSDVPVDHAREAVAECREHGVEVIGLGIGSMDDRRMRETFGEGNYRLTTIDDLADDVIELYEGMMNVSRTR